MAAPAQESGKDFSPRCETVVCIDAFQKEMVCSLALNALGSRICSAAGPAIVVIGNNSWIIPTSLCVKSIDFTEQLKCLPTVHIDADPIITEIEERVVAVALKDNLCAVREHILPLAIVCSPFRKGNERHDIPMVDVWAGPEEFKLVQVLDNNSKFTVMDIRSALSPNSLRPKVPLVTSFGHYELAGSDRRGGIIVDSIIRGHVVSDEKLLTGLEFYATPRMARLRNGINLPILGVGKMETELLDIPHVEFAPSLKADFVSVNQLVSNHGLVCFFDKKGVSIKKENGDVVGAGICEDGRFYVLQNLQVPPPEM